MDGIHSTKRADVLELSVNVVIWKPNGWYTLNKESGRLRVKCKCCHMEAKWMVYIQQRERVS